MKKFIILATAALTGSSVWAGREIVKIYLDDDFIQKYLSQSEKNNPSGLFEKSKNDGIYGAKIQYNVGINDKVVIEYPIAQGTNWEFKTKVKELEEPLLYSGELMIQKMNPKSPIYSTKLNFEGIDKSKNAFFVNYMPLVGDPENLHIGKESDGTSLVRRITSLEQPYKVEKMPEYIDLKD